MRSAETIRFRPPQAIWVAAVIAFIGALPLASAAWYYTPVLLIPLAVGVWAWRSGTDADRGGLRLRALVGQRRIAWSQVVQLGSDDRGRAVALLDDGQTTRLPAVPATELPKLVAASGQGLVTDDEPDAEPVDDEPAGAERDDERQ